MPISPVTRLNQEAFKHVTDTIHQCCAAMYYRSLMLVKKMPKIELCYMLDISRPTLDNVITGGVSKNQENPFISIDMAYKIMQSVSLLDAYTSSTLSAVAVKDGGLAVPLEGKKSNFKLSNKEIGDAQDFLDEVIINPYNERDEVWLKSEEAIQKREMANTFVSLLMKEHIESNIGSVRKLQREAFPDGAAPAVPTLSRLIKGRVSVNYHYSWPSLLYIASQLPRQGKPENNLMLKTLTSVSKASNDISTAIFDKMVLDDDARMRYQRSAGGFSPPKGREKVAETIRQDSAKVKGREVRKKSSVRM